MLRAIFFIALLVTTLLAQSDSGRADLLLNNGTQLRDAKIVLISGDKATIIHSGGMITVDADVVPLDVLARAAQRLEAKEKERTLRATNVVQSYAAREAGQAVAMNLTPVPEALPRLTDRLTLRATGDNGPRRLPENGCAVISNASGVGTGFVVRQSDGFVLVSNQHVIDGKGPMRFELPSARQVLPTGGFLATDRDLAVLDLAETSFKSYFEMEPSVDAVALSEELIIYGNAVGEGMRISKATLVGKNRTEIEVSGGIVHGNSGGPIVRAKTGRVIAVSTYVTIRRNPRTVSDLVEEAVLPKVRFFGVRIDTLARTANFDLGQFVADSENLESDKLRIYDALALAQLALSRQLNKPADELNKAAKKVPSELLQMYKLYGLKSPPMRKKVEEMIRPISPANTFIHAEKRARLEHSREVLADVYKDLLR